MDHLAKRVEDHYATENLLVRIDAALADLGASPTDPDALKPVDEFHTGGREATEALVSHLDIHPGMRVLDIGAGIGGTARLIARAHKVHVTGVDLTRSYVDVAKALNTRTGMDDDVTMMVGSALDLPVAAGSFDVAVMLHVGMNIDDKPHLMREVARVLKPGGHFALFDVMRDRDDGPLAFPVPWSTLPETSFVDHPLAYITAAEGAGLVAEHRRERRDFTLAFFERVMKATAEKGQPPLGIHLLMGATAGEKIRNYVANVQAHRIAPVEMIFRKPG